MILIKKRLWMCHKSGAKVMVKKWDCQGVAFFRGEKQAFYVTR